MNKAMLFANKMVQVVDLTLTLACVITIIVLQAFIQSTFNSKRLRVQTVLVVIESLLFYVSLCEIHEQLFRKTLMTPQQEAQIQRQCHLKAVQKQVKNQQANIRNTSNCKQCLYQALFCGRLRNGILRGQNTCCVSYGLIMTSIGMVITAIVIVGCHWDNDGFLDEQAYQSIEDSSVITEETKEYLDKLNGLLTLLLLITLVFQILLNRFKGLANVIVWTLFGTCICISYFRNREPIQHQKKNSQIEINKSNSEQMQGQQDNSHEVNEPNRSSLNHLAQDFSPHQEEVIPQSHYKLKPVAMLKKIDILQQPFTNALSKRINEENCACSICLIQFEQKDNVIPLKCNSSHIFHVDCLKQWADQDYTCPLCRHPIINSEQEISNYKLMQSRNLMLGGSNNMVINDLLAEDALESTVIVGANRGQQNNNVNIDPEMPPIE